jgi:ribosomal protein L7/L12
LPAQIERELRRLVSTGNKVEAMQRVISLTGAGLRVSKDYVDTLAKAH